MISNCNACQKYQNLNPREPVLSHEISKDVWNKIATVLFVRVSKLYLIVKDYTSKYFKLAQLPNVSSAKCLIISHYPFVYLHKMAYRKQHFVTMDHNIVHMNLRNFLNHGTSYTRLSILSSLQIMGLWRELFKPLRKLYKNAEDNIDPYLAMLALSTTKNSSGTSTLELLMKRKLRTLVTSINVNVNTKTKLKKLTVS